MNSKFLKYYAAITLFVLVAGSIIFYQLLPDIDYEALKKRFPAGNNWYAPNINELPPSPTNDLIRYGKLLIANTSFYLGPKGSVAQISNGLNCQNCHLEAGTRLYGSNFAQVASSYPKYRERSGRTESVEFRVNECMQRSMNGEPFDSLSTEMRAMVAYLKWVGKDIIKGTVPAGTGPQELSYLDRAANVNNGRNIYDAKCRTCHGGNGEGLPNVNYSGYVYPPLWGSNSFNVSAGMYRLSRLASFVKYNMPQNVKLPDLSDEEAWDVAAFINSQQRPQKFFNYDWPNLNSKPVDYPFGPYADSFPELQHKLGPFEPIKKARMIQKKPQ
ncbi:MAG: c-type cytochrome [Ferruginibacter sp.]